MAGPGWVVSAVVVAAGVLAAVRGCCRCGVMVVPAGRAATAIPAVLGVLVVPAGWFSVPAGLAAPAVWGLMPVVAAVRAAIVRCWRVPVVLVVVAA